jgi:hypothetical protein
MPTPAAPISALAETWIARARHLRWIDALAAWLVLCAIVTTLTPELPGRMIAITALGLLIAAIVIRPIRIRWRPISGWAAVAVSRPLRPGDRAWFIRDGTADLVLVTARRGLRMSISMPGLGEAETMRVRRTRVYLVPAS